MKRQETRQVQIKNLKMGGNDDVIIQSMCNIKTSKANQVIHQIHELETLGCQLMGMLRKFHQSSFQNAMGKLLKLDLTKLSLTIPWPTVHLQKQTNCLIFQAGV